MNQTLFVDDSVANFVSCINNGVPILPYAGNDADDELARLTNYLVAVADRPDMIETNSIYFQIAKYKACKSFEDAVLKLYKIIN